MLATLMLAAAEAAAEESSKTAFYVLGAAFAAWAVVLSAIGITRPDFPGDGGKARAVLALSALLMLGAVGSAILTG